ncbi:lipopolysaccharide biosynthesis protein, partial [Micromonospora sp. NPDC049580]
MTAATRPPAGAGPDGPHRSGAGAAGTVDIGAAETRRSARSGVAGLLGAATSGLFGFVLAVVITRGYGTAGAGAFFAAIGVVTVATAVCTLGAETGLMWALPRRRLGVRGDAARVLPVALIPPLLAGLVVAGVGALSADALAPRLLRGSG